MFEVMERGNIRHRNQPLILHVPYMAYNLYDGNNVSVYSKHKDALFIHETWGTAPLYDTYLLIPCSRSLIEKLTCSQIVKKFPAFYGTWNFITAFTSARQLSISWASLIQSMSPHPTFWRYILILSSNLLLGLPSGLFVSGFSTNTLYTPPISPIHCITHLDKSWNIAASRNRHHVHTVCVCECEWAPKLHFAWHKIK